MTSLYEMNCDDDMTCMEPVTLTILYFISTKGNVLKIVSLLIN